MGLRDRLSGDADSDYGLLFDEHHDDDHGDDEHGDDEHHDDRELDRHEDAHVEQPAHHHPAGSAPPRQSRLERGRAQRRQGRRRVFVVGGALLVLVVALVVWLVAIPIYHYVNPQDFDGEGSGSVLVTVRANDGAADIATELKAKGVVASTAAFTDAAAGDARSRSIQPGTYRLHLKMSGGDALTLMLTPSARVDDDVLVTEGATTLDVARRLSAKPCSGGDANSTACGPGYSASAVRAALADVAALGIPSDFLASGKVPSSVEGFLYPATYFFPEDGRPADALQQMITKFAEQLRDTDFTASAKRNGFTPYQQLIAASIAQSEAKYPADMAKVVRVILNRIASKTPLRIDATSAYGAKLKGLDPSKVIYASLDSPYNTYTHDGLPPTPISNPGSEALQAAAHPTAGNWLFYVNADAAGHLFFTNSETAFAKAVETCRAHNWGCG